MEYIIIFYSNINYYFQIGKKALDGQEFKKILGGRIVALRNAKGLSQERLAECIDINPRSLSDLESGKSMASAETFAKLMEFFNLGPYEFFQIPSFQNAKEVENAIYSRISAVKNNKELLTKIYMYLNTII